MQKTYQKNQNKINRIEITNDKCQRKVEEDSLFIMPK